MKSQDLEPRELDYEEIVEDYMPAFEELEEKLEQARHERVEFKVRQYGKMPQTEFDRRLDEIESRIESLQKRYDHLCDDYSRRKHQDRLYQQEHASRSIGIREFFRNK